MEPKELKNITPKLYELKQLGSGFKIPKEYFKSVESGVYSKMSANRFDKTSSFTVPENYFETIEDKVLIAINSEKQENNFSIPKNYFDSVEDRVFEKIKNNTKVISLKSRIIKTFIPIAAAASLLLFITLQLFNNNEPTDLLANLETSEIENWINNGDLELSSYEIAALYEDVNFEDLEINQLYDDENLIEYLNDIDIESLIFTN